MRDPSVDNPPSRYPCPSPGLTLTPADFLFTSATLAVFNSHSHRLEEQFVSELDFPPPPSGHRSVWTEAADVPSKAGEQSPTSAPVLLSCLNELDF